MSRAKKNKHTGSDFETVFSQPRIGDTLLELEPVLEQLVDTHDLQHGDVLALIDVWLTVHRPAAKEQYTDGSPSPTMSYGPPRRRT